MNLSSSDFALRLRYGARCCDLILSAVPTAQPGIIGIRDITAVWSKDTGLSGIFFSDRKVRIIHSAKYHLRNDT